jgi:hypothetical protein
MMVRAVMKLKLFPFEWSDAPKSPSVMTSRKHVYGTVRGWEDTHRILGKPWTRAYTGDAVKWITLVIASVAGGTACLGLEAVQY